MTTIRSSGSLPRLLTAREAAQVLAVSPRKLWELTNTKALPCVRIGRSVRYDAEDVLNFIEQLKQKNRHRSSDSDTRA